MSRVAFFFSAFLLASVAVLPAQADPYRGTSQMGGGFIEFLMTGAVPSHRQGAPVMARQALPDALPRHAGRGHAINPPVQRSRQLAALPEEGQLIQRRDEARIRAAVDPEFERQEVTYHGPHGPGTIVIDTPNRFLYLVQGNGRALRYGIGVGRPGFEWAGVKSVTRKAEWPDWRPPAQMLKRRPDLPTFMSGGPDNPLGARALYLGSSLYRIHGTNEPETIGRAVSSGCIRMNNEDVIDLYDRVKVGTRVVVL
ncbi:MAG: L,D-transpeptidase [Methylobacterium sp.]|jgi:lipoprotein-anchoring transpeptidase ErfK/SrfK|nr:L,D-transpeptidase [Methylobacterium sp.]MCA3607493.1 L,D-transpeptidase [Methylobacterium sp.]MCA3610011.1 L,D-transpeptidase [Methylobacterium sp.]MCA3617649.1 L,D-transpeptidase [Methylobacterium sp.]MCA3620250.1 L,D-transpeptidase [Methylobacterium sp.]